MDSLTSVSKPSMVFPPSNPLLLQRRRLVFLSLSSPPSDARFRPRLSSFFALPCSPPHPSTRRFLDVSCKSEVHDDADDLERALHLDGTIPGTSNDFVKHVSSRAYDMRRHLHQTFDSSSYDVLETNPWRETSKPVYVLTHKENQLCTMKTRRNRSEVERELGLLFSKGGKWRSKIGNQAKQSRTGTKFQMLVEDIREGVLAHNHQYVGEVSMYNIAHGPQVRQLIISSKDFFLFEIIKWDPYPFANQERDVYASINKVFEDENEAAKYCDLLQGRGQGCEGVAEIDASSVFDLCRKMRALAVLFRRGRTPPLPDSLQLNLRARKRSLEDQEDFI